MFNISIDDDTELDEVELNTRLRKKIEWHFKNYSANQKLYREQIEEIAESGTTTAYNQVAGGRGGISNPTEDKALLLCGRGDQSLWAKVVEHTYTAFKWEAEYKIMIKIYAYGKKQKDLELEGLDKRTFLRWRDKWIGCAYKWAKEYGLI